MLCIIQCLFHTLFEACTLHRWQLFHPCFLHACCSVRVRQARQHLFALVSFRCWYKSCLMDSSSRSIFFTKNVDHWGVWTCFVCHLPNCSSNGKKHNHSEVTLKVSELVLNGRQALHTLFLRWMTWTTWQPIETWTYACFWWGGFSLLLDAGHDHDKDRLCCCRVVLVRLSSSQRSPCYNGTDWLGVKIPSYYYNSSQQDQLWKIQSQPEYFFHYGFSWLHLFSFFFIVTVSIVFSFDFIVYSFCNLWLLTYFRSCPHCCPWILSLFFNLFLFCDCDMVVDHFRQQSDTDSGEEFKYAADGRDDFISLLPVLKLPKGKKIVLIWVGSELSHSSSDDFTSLFNHGIPKGKKTVPIWVDFKNWFDSPLQRGISNAQCFFQSVSVRWRIVFDLFMFLWPRSQIEKKQII